MDKHSEAKVPKDFYIVLPNTVKPVTQSVSRGVNKNKQFIVCF